MTVAAATVILIAGVGLVVLARRLPVEEARRFMTAPIEVGNRPVPAPEVAVSAEEVAGRYATAEAAFHTGDYAEAATHFAWVVAHDPSGPKAGPAQWNLTRSRLRSGDGMGALAALDDLLKKYADYLGAESPGLRRGLDRMASGKLGPALNEFDRMTKDQPESDLVPLAHAMTARIHWSRGEPMETVRAFGRMFGSVRDRVPAYEALSVQLDRYARGEPDAPENFARLARQGDEGFRDVYQYLAARSLLEQDRFEATHDALEDLRRKYPDGDFTHIVDLEHAWNLLRNGNPADALAIFQRLEQTPAPAAARAFNQFFDIEAELPLGIARCQLALGHDAEAVTAFERALATSPGIYALQDRIGLALAHERLGHLDDAATVLRAAIKDYPDDPKLWALRQQLARIEGQLAAAR